MKKLFDEIQLISVLALFAVSILWLCYEPTSWSEQGLTEFERSGRDWATTFYWVWGGIFAVLIAATIGKKFSK